MKVIGLTKFNRVMMFEACDWYVNDLKEITVYSANYRYTIRKKDSMSKGEASEFLRSMFMLENVDLDAYNMFIADFMPIDLNAKRVSNEIDENLNTIPLEVVIVNK